MLAMHTADMGLISGIQDGPQMPVGIIPEHIARSAPWVYLAVTQKLKIRF